MINLFAMSWSSRVHIFNDEQNGANGKEAIQKLLFAMQWKRTDLNCRCFFSLVFFFVFISKSLESCRLKKSTQNWKHVKSSNANKDTLFRYVHLHTYISNMSLQLYSIPNIVQNKNSFKICYVLACLLEESKTVHYRAHVHYILLCAASP